jgi:hypothetical protein
MRHKPSTAGTPTPDRQPAPDPRQSDMTVAEVAAMMRVAEDTVRGWCLRGEIAPVFNIGSEKAPRYRIPRQSVLEKFRLVEPLRLE